MNVKKVFGTVVGLFQIVIGLFAVGLAYLLLYNPDYFEIRTILGLQEKFVAFFFLLLGIIGFFSIVSGALLMHEWLSEEELYHG